jgi:hypothetical protein
LEAQPDPATVVVKRISVSFALVLIGLIFRHFDYDIKNGKTSLIMGC